MDPDRFFASLYVACGVIFLTALAAALTLSSDFTVPVGISLGFALGIVPFVSWHLIGKVTRGFTRKDRIGIAVGIGLGKYAVIGAVTFVLLKQGWVNWIGFVGGATAVVVVLAVLGLAMPGQKLEKKTDAGGEDSGGAPPA